MIQDSRFTFSFVGFFKGWQICFHKCPAKNLSGRVGPTLGPGTALAASGCWPRQRTPNLCAVQTFSMMESQTTAIPRKTSEFGEKKKGGFARGKKSRPDKDSAKRGLAKRGIGQKRNWPKEELAKRGIGQKRNWPKEELAKRGIGQKRNWPKEVAALCVASQYVGQFLECCVIRYRFFGINLCDFVRVDDVSNLFCTE